jgi:hypothetical protein
MKRRYRAPIGQLLAWAAAGAVVIAAPQSSTRSASKPEGAKDRPAGTHATMETGGRIRFMGMAVRSSPPTEPVEINLARWSNPGERDQVLAAFAAAKTPDAFQKQVGSLPALGSIRTVSGRGTPIYFAQRVKQPNTMDRLLLVTGPLYYWKPESTVNMVQPNYSVVQIQLSPAGTGKGWVSYDGQHVKLDERGKTLELDDLNQQQPQLMNIKPLGPTDKDLDASSSSSGQHKP